MSLDKLVDSTQLDSDLTYVANAIRTAGGTSASLSFPSGFVTAIGNLSGGGGGSGVPSSWVIDEYTPTSALSEHTIPHTLGVKPDIVIIVPSSFDGSSTGQSNPQVIFGSSGTNAQLTDYPYRLINNYINTSSTWDYSGSPNNYGWNADTSNIYIRNPNSNIIHLIKHYVISIKF